MKLNFIVSKKKMSIVIIIFLFVSCNNSQQSQNQEKEIAGYVPNRSTAIKITEAILLPIYGEKIYDEKPFTTKLQGDSIWIVTGSLKEGVDGGVASVKIKVKNGEILEVSHGK